MHGDAPQRELQLGVEPDAVPRARRFAAAVLNGLASGLVGDAELVVTELVTNALLYAGPPVTLRVLPRRDLVRLQGRRPQPGPAAAPGREHRGDDRAGAWPWWKACPSAPASSPGGRQGRLVRVDRRASRSMSISPRSTSTRYSLPGRTIRSSRSAATRCCSATCRPTC